MVTEHILECRNSDLNPVKESGGMRWKNMFIWDK